MKGIGYKHLEYPDCENNGGTKIDICFFDDSISISVSYEYMDWGTGNRLGHIQGSKHGRVHVSPNQSIEEIRSAVFLEIARLASFGIYREDLPLTYFERYK